MWVKLSTKRFCTLKYRHLSLSLTFVFIFTIISLSFASLSVHSAGNFEPTGGVIVVGSTATRTSNGTSGNVGSWKGTIAQDQTSPGFTWTIDLNTGAGFDHQVQIDNAVLNGGNKMNVIIRAASNSISVTRTYQICDWVSTSNVDNATDGQCTGGGWRTLNLRKATIASTTMTTYSWDIYDGYWTTSTTGNTSVSTPLSNFIKSDATKRVLVRGFSTTTGVTSTHSIDWVRVTITSNPQYSAAAFTQTTGGTVTTSYINTINGLSPGQSAVDTNYLSVPGTAGAISDFYLTYKKVKTYTGMNTILVVANYGCSTTGINITPKIWNFNSSTWENLSGAIACSATQVTGQFAKTSATITHYISGGDIRIGWFGSANNTLSVRIDMQYIMVGSTNSNTALCQISMGTVANSTTCAGTNSVDSTSGSPVLWQATTELESAAMGHDYYPFDNDGDATGGESAVALNLSIGVTPPSNAAVAEIAYATRWRSNSASLTTVPSIRDFQANNGSIDNVWTANSGWTALNTSNASSSYTYSDGFMDLDATDYIDTVNNLVNIRFRTAASTISTAVTEDIDFVMVSISWVESPASMPTLRSLYGATGGLLVTNFGTETAITSNAATGNVGSWKGTFFPDSLSWTVNANIVNGLNQQLQVDNVALSGANKMSVAINVSASLATLSRVYQICDWVSTTSVDNAADAQCTGGGWRTLNIRKVAITATGSGTYAWDIYDGYWTTSPTGNTPVSTPLSNFIKTDSTKRVLIRAYSTSAVGGTHTFDRLRVNMLVDPVYSASGFTQLTGGTVTTSYVNTVSETLGSGAVQSAVDSTYLSVPGTAGAVSNFYLSYGNVKTYTGANTILIVSNYGCSTTGVNIMPKIYNFSSSTWENLSTSTIACSATQATGFFAKNGISNIADYVSSGEVRIGWTGSANNTLSIRLDMQFIILGSTNSNTSLCEISFGTVANGTTCANTANIDTTLASPSLWQATTETESAAMSHDYYAFDNDGDGTGGESAMAMNLGIGMTSPGNASLSNLVYLMSWRSNSASLTTLNSIHSSEGMDSNGGWFGVGTPNSSAIFSQTATSLKLDTTDYIDPVLNRANVRIRTSASTIATPVTGDVDFVMLAPAWLEGPAPVLEQEAYRFYNNTNSTDVGTVLAAQNSAAALGGAADTAFRLRMLVHSSVAQLPIGTAFKLQFAGKGAGTCAAPSGTPSSYTDVTGSTAIAFKDNTTPTSGSVLTANANDPTSSYTIANQTYVEANNFTNSQSALPDGYTGKWDFSLFDNSGGTGSAYCFRIVKSDGTALNTYTNYPQITVGSAPTAPSLAFMAQQKTTNVPIATNGWTNELSVKFVAVMTDPDSPDTLSLCVEKKPIANAFVNTEDTCGTPTSYTGVMANAEVTIGSLVDTTEYHWQVRFKDAAGHYSGWTSFGGNAESVRDFGVDTTPPSALTVRDGTLPGTQLFNNGTLTTLSSNWGSLNANVSGLLQYEYSIGTTVGATNIVNWTNIGVSVGVTNSSLTLQTSQMYYFNIRVTDNAGNTAVFSSPGQRVPPSISFSLSSSSVTFARLNSGNSFSASQTTLITTSTDAFNGYEVRLFKTDLLRSPIYPANTIPDFSAGSYASPASWGAGIYGFGYTSNDTTIQGVNKFAGATLYAPFSSTPPGDIVADHTATVSGTPIVGEQFQITYKVQTPSTQLAGPYTTTLVYTVIPKY
jgi:hypothetical protein